MHSMEAEFRHARLQAFIHLKVKHPRLQEIDDTLMQAMRGHRIYTLLPLYGASGVGKSTVLKHVAERCRAEETDPACVPVVEVQASPEDIGASARLDYYRQILDQLRTRSVAVNDRVKHLSLLAHPGKKSSDPAEWLDMREAVVYAFALLRVKGVFVDEAQHLMSVDTPHKPTSQLDWLKALTNRTNVLHIKYNLNSRRRLVTPMNAFCGRMKKAGLFITSVQKELFHARYSLGVLPPGCTIRACTNVADHAEKFAISSDHH